MKRAIAVVATLVVLAGCGGYDDTVVPDAQPASPAPAGPDTLQPCQDDGSQLRSYAPAGDAADSADVREIRQRGKLVAGVASDTFLLGARDPGTGKLEGFDIDMVRAIAAEIFPGDEPDSRIDFRVITAAQRIPFLQDGTIDIVARNMTVNCARWQQIAFSAIYYNAGQKVLVQDPKFSGIESIGDLAGKRICAPAGTTSIDNIQKIQPEAIPVTSTDNSACMVLFQNGEADGVSTDDTVLAGLAAQDPYAKVLDTPFLTQEPYGIGVNRDKVDLVRLINKVLEDMRRDGRWQATFEKTIGRQLPDVAQPKPAYGR